MTARHRAVWYGNQRVGALREDNTRTLRFTYDPRWLDQGGFPISIHLPRSNADQEEDAHGFCQGLLPEGPVRQRICRQRRIDPNDDAGLLFAIGEDCAGALSVLPAGAAPDSGTKPPEPLAAEDVDRLIRSRGAEPVVPGEKQRFSLAGVQEKQPVIHDGRSYALPDRMNPSSHILKFESLPRVCFAEFVTSDIARRIGLPVVDTEFLRTVGAEATPYLRIRRYDRTPDERGRLQRLHQEDLLQALGMPSPLKYQSDGGPSIGDIAGVLRAHTARPVEALERLRDWQMFNLLVGNWDGHAKNLALLYEWNQTVPVLAPFYDLVAIEFFNLVRPGDDLWARIFELADTDARERGKSDLVPYWIAPGDWRVQRHVPLLPYTSEVEAFQRLKRQLAAYRVVFGQPRQEELVTLIEKMDIDSDELGRWSIELSP